MWLSFYELQLKNISLAWLELPQSTALEKPNFHKTVEITIIDKLKKTLSSHWLPHEAPHSLRLSSDNFSFALELINKPVSGNDWCRAIFSLPPGITSHQLPEVAAGPPHHGQALF